jgi:hypothetical protein
MCLESVGPRGLRVKNQFGKAWKLFHKNKNRKLRALYKGKTHVDYPVGEWLSERDFRNDFEAECYILPDYGKRYRKGFHLYLDRKEAFSIKKRTQWVTGQNVVCRKVLYEYPNCEGFQRTSFITAKAVVARWIKIVPMR